jgi:hypothetical protein
MTATVLVLAVLAQAAAPAPAEPKRPAIAIQSATSGPVSVFYLDIPWGPNTFAAMEKPGEGFYNRRAWPFARLQTKAPFTLEGKPVPAGNYALLFHPSTPEDKTMSLEVRKIAVPEFLEAGNVMAPAPPGETVMRVPIVFETVPETTPTLRLEVAPAKDATATTLTVRYGDRRLVRELRH